MVTQKTLAKIEEVLKTLPKNLATLDEALHNKDIKYNIFGEETRETREQMEKSFRGLMYSWRAIREMIKKLKILNKK